MPIAPRQILTCETGKCAECDNKIYLSGEIWTCESCTSQFSVVYTRPSGVQEPFEASAISYGLDKTIYQVLRGPFVKETTTASEEGGGGRMGLLLGQTQELTQVQVAVKPLSSQSILDHLYTGYDGRPYMEMAEAYIDSVLKRPKLPIIRAEASDDGVRVVFKDEVTHQTEKRLPSRLTITDKALGMPGYGSGVAPGTAPESKHKQHTPEELEAERKWASTLDAVARPAVPLRTREEILAHNVEVLALEEKRLAESLEALRSDEGESPK